MYIWAACTTIIILYYKVYITYTHDRIGRDRCTTLYGQIVSIVFIRFFFFYYYIVSSRHRRRPPSPPVRFSMNESVARAHNTIGSTTLATIIIIMYTRRTARPRRHRVRVRKYACVRWRHEPRSLLLLLLLYCEWFLSFFFFIFRPFLRLSAPTPSHHPPQATHPGMLTRTRTHDEKRANRNRDDNIKYK